MSRFSFQIALSLVLSIYVGCVFGLSSGAGEPKLRCVEAERGALLKIKEDLRKEGSGGVLSSWGNEEEKKECCNWVGIRCSNNSGHVIRLDLSSRTIGYEVYQYNYGQISSYVAKLQYLNYLDLSGIGLEDIPSVLGNLTKLRYLNLSHTTTSEIPPQFSNLSSLQVLDLSSTYLRAKSLHWLSRISSLRHLNLGGTYLSNFNNWMQIISKLPYLTHLELGNTYLPNIVPPSRSFFNSSASLTYLDLCSNNLSVSIHQWLFNSSTNSLVYLDLHSNQLQNSILEAILPMTALEYLDISHNPLEGSISEAFGNMTGLAYLDLSNNMFGGEFPKNIGNITTLRTLSIGFNNLWGYVPESIGQLSELEKLDISRNSLGGVISETYFSKLSKLSYLDLSFNTHLTLDVPFDWIPPFQLSSIFLGDCKMGPKFPKWLQTQRNYYELDISNVGISDFIPNWFWNLSTHFKYMNLSNNQISGTVVNPSSELVVDPAMDLNYPAIDLSSNQFEGPIPDFLFKVSFVYLSGNKFSKLDSLCDVVDDTRLALLDVSYNQFSGELPDCWSHLNNLFGLILTNNNLSGRIPVSIGSLFSIETLHLGENSLTEELPSSLMNCTFLRVLDVGENNILGPIPTWIGENLSSLVILILRSNNFYGSMPSSLCSLLVLQILDLSSNNISGRIPKCFSNFTSMKENESTGATISILYSISARVNSEGGTFGQFFDEAQFIWKGRKSGYRSTLGLVRDIDLSSNKLMGEIPDGLTELIGLVSFNLSRNNLSGQIPSEMGRLKWLDALDLSNNQFSGVIPLSLSEVDRLNVLDLSNNNLSGKIPTSTQLQSFDASAYMGNPKLCGAPLAKCPGEEHESPGAKKESDDDEEGQDGLIPKGFYVSAALGFVIGFWGVSGSLLLIRSRRHYIFQGFE